MVLDFYILTCRRACIRQRFVLQRFKMTACPSDEAMFLTKPAVPEFGTSSACTQHRFVLHRFKTTACHVDDAGVLPRRNYPINFTI